MTRQRTPISATTIEGLKIAWAIWSEVGDLDRYPTTEEARVIMALAREVNGWRYKVLAEEIAARMADNYYYPFEDPIAQRRAFMFEPGSWGDDLSYVDRHAAARQVLALPKVLRLGLVDAYTGERDWADPRAKNFASLTRREQSTITQFIRENEKRAS